MKPLLALVAFLSVPASSACNQSNSQRNGSGGATTPSGGAVSASGGNTANTGGSAQSGGIVSAGGSSGGANGSGGAPGTGGISNTGGAAQASGGAATGGVAAGGSGGAATGGTTINAGSTGGKASGGTSGGAGGNGTGGATGAGGSVTCPAVSLQPGDTNKTISVGGLSRTYILHVPQKYDGKTAVPLVLDFHGIGGSGAAQSGATQYKAVTDPEGVITLYPDGKPGPQGNAWNIGPCCVANVDDIAFAKALVAETQKIACIDAKRVYAVGYSMGGGMSHYIGCHAAEVFAAVAPAAFDLLKENQDGCTPSRPITEIQFRSTGDGTVPYAGGFSSYVPGMSINFLGAQATFKKWAQIDQCTGSPSAEDSNGCSTYSSCAGGVQVTLCTKQGGGHDEGTASVGWPLLKKYTLP